MDIQKLAQAIYDMLCEMDLIDYKGVVEVDIVNAIGDLIEELG
jgi:hypothetical protein